MDSRSVLSRFEAERQALALMDHPNIAKVLDGGTTENGRPFFVMEYVEGVPFTKYCDDARLSIDARLALFVIACQAVQHAHTKGIVHRDLKPSNILIGLYDGHAVPKVIDFGLAKALHGPLTDCTLQTSPDVMLGTPLYISPEQAEFNNPDVDTRTDIYALGVILYELLTGSTPLEPGRFQRAAWHEILQFIKEEEPPRPSERLSSSASLPSLAAERQLEPSRLTRLVRGELDWIAMKCLEKDRSRRYDTASGLARDVQRFLADESVEACPPSTGYRLRKFARRNRGPVLAASVILFMLVGGVAGTTWGLISANRARSAEAERAEGERAANERASRRLRQVERGSELLASVFNDLDPRAEAKDGRPLRAILGDRLARVAEQLQGEEAGDPLPVAGLQDRLGLSLLHLGMPRLAIPLFEKSRATRTSKSGANDPDTLAGMNNLGRAYHEDGQLDKAVPLLEETYRLMKARMGAGHASSLSLANNLATAYLDAGGLDRALPLYEETFELQKSTLGPDHVDTLNTMNNLALTYQARGRMRQAMPLLERALELRRGKFGPHHADTLNSMNNLADGYRADGKLDRALPLWEETLALRKAHLGPDHTDTLNTMANLAAAYRKDNQVGKAMPLLEEAFLLIKAKRGPDHPNTLTAMNNLAVGYRADGHPEKATPLLEEALGLARAKHGPDHATTLGVMSNLAGAYRAARKLDQALPLYEEILRMRRARQGDDNPDTLVSMSNLASAYRADGKLDRALPLWEEAYRLARERGEPDHPNTLTLMNNLAGAYRAAGRPAEAIPLLREAAEGFEKRRFRDDVAGGAIHHLVEAHEEAGQFAQAEGWRRKWLAVVKERSGVGSPAYAGELEALGSNLLRQEKWDDASPTLSEALAILEAKGEKSREVDGLRSMLGAALLGLGKHADAEPLLLRGYEGLRSFQGPPTDLRHVAEAGERIVRLYEAWGRVERAKEWRARLSGGDVGQMP
jgi:tetratricopeptide (TPR) repeat protein